MRDYSKLLELLRDQEVFPLEYTHKIIGAQTSAFEDGIQELIRQHPGLKIATRRETQDRAHVAVTFQYTAQRAEDVIILLEASHQVPDVRVIL
jgi:putative lipoic acid-binding regulatory protein